MYRYYLDGGILVNASLEKMCALLVFINGICRRYVNGNFKYLKGVSSSRKFMFQKCNLGPTFSWWLRLMDRKYDFEINQIFWC